MLEAMAAGYLTTILTMIAVVIARTMEPDRIKARMREVPAETMMMGTLLAAMVVGITAGAVVLATGAPMVGTTVVMTVGATILVTILRRANR